MTETELRAWVKQGKCGGILLWGEEDFLKRYYLTAIRDAVLADCPPGLEAMNRIVLGGEDGDIGSLADALAAPAVMAPRKIVEFVPSDMASWREREKKAFLTAIEALSETEDTVLVAVAPRGGLDAGTAKRPSAFFRSLSEHLTPVELPLQTGARLRRWVERHFAEASLTLTDAAVETLLTRCPPDMTGLSGEIEKLISYAHANGLATLTPAEVAAVTAPSLREDAFALANAMLAGDRTAALDALDGYKKRREEPAAVLASLSRVMSDLLLVATLAAEGADKGAVARATKMHEYKAMLYMRAASEFGIPRLRATLARCLDADRLTKTMPLGYIPLERFVCTIPRGAAAKERAARNG